jgi:Mediator complex subunit 15
MCEKLDQLLPIFLAMTANGEATKRLILMKHMFQDQLNVLPQNKFLISLDHMQKLKDHFTKYFTWIRNAMSGASQQQAADDGAGANVNAAAAGNLASASPVSPQQTAQNQGAAAQNANRNMPNAAKLLPNQTAAAGMQQIQQQQIANAQQSAQQQPQMPNAAAMQSGLGLKHGNIDLKLPASKRQKGADSPATSSQAQPQQQASPAAKLQASPTAAPGVTAAQGEQLDTTAQGDTANGGRPANTQVIIQAAIAAGYPPQVVVKLPQKALQANWVLQKAAQGKANIKPQQQQQIQAMLNDMVNQVKQQIANEANNAQAQAMAQAHVSAAANHQNTASRGPATPPKVIDLESTANSITNPITLDAVPTSHVSNASVIIQDTMKQEPDTGMSAMTYSMPAQLNSSQVMADSKIITSTGTSLLGMATDSFSTIRPGMTADGRVVNANLFTADIIKDLITILSRPDNDQMALKELPESTEIYESLEDSKGGVMFETATKEVATKPVLFAPFSEDPASLTSHHEGFSASIAGEGESDAPSSRWYSLGMDPQIPDMSEFMHGFDILECS